MELNGEVAINAPRERVWAALNDATVLQACIPGCEEVVDESPTVRKARVMIKLGPVRARFNGKVTLSEMDAPSRCVMGFEGNGGAAGMASGRSHVELHDNGADTRLTYTVKAAVAGKLGQIGGRMIDASARQLADQFFEALRTHLAGVPAPSIEAVAEAGEMPAGQQPAEVPAVSATQQPVAAAPAPVTSGEASRVLWFLLGAGATALGVWLGKVLF